MPYCIKCGALNPDNKNFCSKCGNKLSLSEINEMSYTFREFLLRVSTWVKPIDNLTKQYWARDYGLSDNEINYFLQLGLIKGVDVIDKFYSAYTIKDFKDLAKRYSVKYKSNSKKREIVDALLIGMPKDVSESILSEAAGIELYRATEKGRAVIEKHEIEKKITLEKLEKDVKAFLRIKDIKTASTIIVQYRCSTQLILPTGGMFSPHDWNDGMPNNLMETALILLNYSYPDLMTEETIKKEIAVHLAYCVLMNKSEKEMGEGILLKTGGVMPCPDLIDYIQSPDNETLDDDSSDHEELAYIYACTKYSMAINKSRLKQYLDNKSDEYNRIEISYIDDVLGCSFCKKGKHIFDLSNIKNIPVLPRHWGCRCSYLPKASE